MAINYGLSDKSKAGRRLLAQVMAARQWAQMKANRRFKREKSNKQPYKPGVTVLGQSAVSEAIKVDWDGEIVPRRNRRLALKDIKETFGVGTYYNGEGPVRTPHNIRPSNYARG